MTDQTSETPEFEDVNPNATEFVQYVVDKQPVDFGAAVGAALYDRVRTAIDVRRQAIAGPLFANK